MIAGGRALRTATLLALMALGLAVDTSRAAEPLRRPPNLLLIVDDDQAAETMGIEGDAHGATPNLDGLARQGSYFRRAYCNNPLCTPSRQSFISGKLPHATGVTRLPTALPESVRTLGHMLGERGYRTAAVGKMHFNDTSNHGFALRRDYAEWLKHLGAHPPPAGDNRKPWRPMVDPTADWLNSGVEDAGLDTGSMDATYFVNRAVRFMKEEPGRPFALVVSFYEPHAPFHFPVEYRGRFHPDQFAAPPVSVRDRFEQPTVFCGLEPRHVRGIQASYYTSLAFVDEQIGRLVRTLDDNGLGNDTLVVFLSDNGYMLGRHGRFEKHCFYESAVRVPLLFRQPGRIPTDRRVGEMVELVDVLPTILALLGQPAPPGLHGRDMSGLVLGRPGAVGRSVVFSEYNENEEAMARTDRYKLIVGSGRRPRKDGYAPAHPPTGPYERLFDVQADPNEDHDLSAEPAFAAVKVELTRSLAERFRATWEGPEPVPACLSDRGVVEWCLTPRDKPNPWAGKHM
ncbi:sulfatase family protein [Paludisphaera rhizosphaerae]|uniref:sulfatase family protein n=1 Tax=Paludisphaera rhizosphaerae TaxID=2711216 RepID=UPI0013EB01BA|nr:sulfatase-like hydrolase/transferase [Paludisphaera rhizosphaerae]